MIYQPTFVTLFVHTLAPFGAGNLGPDVYPDFITGQVTTHPGIDGDWQTKDWLRNLYQYTTGKELAFAAGYICHASADVFAHTYVNAYAGDIFILTDERRVALRHFVLEKYIDYHLEPNPDTVEVPAEFLRDRLIYNENAARLSMKSGAALHISAMYGVWCAVIDLDKELGKLDSDFARVLGEVTSRLFEDGAKLADGETELGIANTALETQEHLLATKKKLLEEAYGSLSRAINDVEEITRRINYHREQVRLVEIGINTVADTITTVNAAITDLEKLEINLNRRLAEVQQYVTEKVCQTVEEVICKLLPPPLNEVCEKVTRLVCYEVQKVNEAWQSVTNQLTDVMKKLADARKQIVDQAAEKARLEALRANELAASIQEEARKTVFDTARVDAQGTYDVAKAQYDAELVITTTARQKADELRQVIASLRAQIIDAERVKEAITALVDHVGILTAYSGNWRRGLEVAGREFIEASLLASNRMIKGTGGSFSAYVEWLKCYGSAYSPVPYQVGEGVCIAESEFERITEEIDRFVGRILPEPFATLYREYEALKARVKTEVKGAVDKAIVELVKFTAPDSTTADFIELLANPENATEDKLNEVFATSDDSAKKLLVFEQVSTFINSDLGLENGRLDLEVFKPLEYASIMARLALLSSSELRRLVWRLGGDPQKVVVSDTGGHYSALFDTTRSIDGNHQWQPYGLPYPRATGVPEPKEAEKRKYGYGHRDGDGHRFPLFMDKSIREIVFLELFPEKMGGEIMTRQELMMPNYPFPECKRNPFPIAFDEFGSPKDVDDECVSVKPARRGFVRPHLLQGKYLRVSGEPTRRSGFGVGSSAISLSFLEHRSQVGWAERK